MALPSLETRFLEYLNKLKSDPEKLKAIDQFNNSKAFRDQFLKIDPLDPERNVRATPESLKAHEAYRKAGVGKVPEMLKTGEETALKEMPIGTQANTGSGASTPKATQSTLRKAVNNVSNKATIAKEYGKILAENTIDKARTGLSAVRAVPWVSAGAAPLGVALAGMGWALMNGSRMDNNGTTKQLANEMNQAFKAGLYVDDEGNYVDADTNEIVGPEAAAKRIDAANTPEVSNAPVGASEPGMEYPASEVPSISSIDGGYAEYENPNAPVVAPSAPLVSNPLSNLNGLSAADLATAVIRGKYGNGDARRKALGDRYAEVQALVNQRMQGASPVTKATPAYSVESPRRADRMVRPMTIGEAYERGMGNFTVLPDEPNKYIK